MPRRTHYSPCIDRLLVCALYHEARRLRQPMTKVANDLLTRGLNGTQAWSIANQQMQSLKQGPAS